MRDLLGTDSIICLNCHWDGRVNDLHPRSTAPSEEDAIDFMQCPNCGEDLAIRGWIDFILIPNKAMIRASES